MIEKIYMFLAVLLDKGLCWMGAHNWRNGPGAPCASCGEPDTFWDQSDSNKPE